MDDAVGLAEPGLVEPVGRASGTALRSSRERRAAWLGTAVAVGLFWLLATSGQPWRLFDAGPFTADFYDAQAHALLSGRLDVPADVALIEGFDVDGRTYLYFGVGPALLRLPVAAVTDAADGRLTVLSMLVAVAVLGTAAGRLAQRARRAGGPDRERPVAVGVFAAGAALATPVLFLASRGVVYHEAALWGAAAALVGLDLLLGWWSAPTTRRLLGAVAVAAFALACRPTSGLAPLLALGLFVLVLLVRRQWRVALPGVAGGAVVVASYVIVNFLRFGQLATVPFGAQRYSAVDAARQAALAANGGNLFGVSYAPTTLWHYLSPFSLSMDVQRLFPFVEWNGRATVLGRATFDTIDRASSIWLAAPVACLLALIGVWWIVRHDRTQGWRVLFAASVVATAGIFTIGFVAHRYLVDLVPVLVVAGAPGLWALVRWADSTSVAWRRLVGTLLVVLAVVGALGQVALAVQARYLYVVPSDGDRLTFLDVRYRIDALLTDGAPGSVVAVVDELPAPDDGTVAIVGDCAGLYVADGLRWYAVEWEADGGRRLVLTPEDSVRSDLGERSVVVAEGDEWRVVAEPAGERQVVFVYDGRTGADPVVVRSDPVDVGGIDLVDVIADPATTQLIVRTGSDEPLSLFYVATEGLSPGPGWSPGPGPAPLCDALAARLPPTG
ncbi:MAG: hypothetical protein MUE36_13725 [Acidimicrobiales bacterium]|nr:hypothetical protein [Acidimicrobiales bacterium]